MAMNPEAIELSEAPQPGANSMKLQQALVNGVSGTSILQSHEAKPEAESEPDETLYPHGMQFVLISMSLCFCVFLVGLVSATIC